MHGYKSPINCTRTRTSTEGGAPPLHGWTVALHCDASAGLRPPACQASAGPVGGLAPAPHLVPHAAAQNWLTSDEEVDSLDHVNFAQTLLLNLNLNIEH